MNRLPHIENGPAAPSEITNPTLILCAESLYNFLLFIDPRLGNPGEAWANTCATDAGVYVSHAIDPATRELTNSKYKEILTDLARLEELNAYLSAEEQALIETDHDRTWRNDLLHGHPSGPPRGGPLSPWEELVKERIIHDVTWRQRLLEGLSDKQPINSCQKSAQNRLLVEARGHGMMFFTHTSHYESLLRQLDHLPLVFTQIKERLKAGVTERPQDMTPLEVMEEVEQQLSTLLDSASDPSKVAEHFYPPNLYNAQWGPWNMPARYEDIVKSRVLPAYEDLRTFLRREYLPYCDSNPTKNPYHAERYELSVRYYMDDDTMTPKRYGELAAEWADEAEQELRAIRHNEFPEAPQGKDLWPFLGMLRKGPLEHPPTLEAIRAEYLQIQLEHRKLLSPLFPDWAEAIVANHPLEYYFDDHPLFSKEFATYQWPSFDGLLFNEGRGKVIEPVPDVATFNWGGTRRHDKHEGGYGHHLHFLARMLQMHLTRYLRFVALHPFGLESAPKYTEHLGERDKWERGEGFTADLHEARVMLLDYAYNVEGATDEQLVAKQAARYGTAERERNRVRRDAGNYGVYQSGRRKVQEIRNNAERALGPYGFSEQEFHDIMLREGPLQPSMLERRVQQWVAARLLRD